MYSCPYSLWLYSLCSQALDAGVDLICAQGGEGGGHTGDVPTSVLIPVVADLCRSAHTYYLLLTTHYGDTKYLLWRYLSTYSGVEVLATDYESLWSVLVLL